MFSCVFYLDCNMYCDICLVLINNINIPPEWIAYANTVLKSGITFLVGIIIGGNLCDHIWSLKIFWDFISDENYIQFIV